MELGSNGLQMKGSGAAPIVPDGVLFKTIEPSRYTSFRTGDEGWRAQNGLFDYTPPTNPAVIAELDYSIGANFFFKLKSPLVVGGVSSTTRFVDINGIQAFSSTGNANLVLIDKLTNRMYTRTNIDGLNYNWNTSIDLALSHSIVVKSITYDDWFLFTMAEAVNSFGCFFNSSFVDPITAVQLTTLNGSSFVHTSTTLSEETTYSQSFRYMATASGIYYDLKTATRQRIFVRNATNLITAP
jgi:hypothetical protein